jgi:hypothetical protein
MFEPIADVLEYWGVPDVDTSLPLVACAKCGGIICRCVTVDGKLPELDETTS